MLTVKNAISSGRWRLACGLLISALALSACSRDDTPESIPQPEPEPEPTGWIYRTAEMSMDINGSFWSTDSSVNALLLWEKDTSFIDMAASKDLGGTCSEFSFSFHNIPLKLGRHSLFRHVTGNYEIPQYTVFYGVGDCHSSCDVFSLLEADSANNWIAFTSERDRFTEFSGEFSATFVRTQGCPITHFPDDTLRIRNGRFHMKRD